ncbi:MAG: hypothetical protein K9M96_16965 [Deltaproteobacteria bacterium]|nr:hypothetical protein [Deltaproteobacteria bacterium]
MKQDPTGECMKGEETDGLNTLWIKDPARIERARIVLVVALSKKSKGELVDLMMNWLEDSEIQRFCEKYLDDSDLAYIEGRKMT